MDLKGIVKDWLEKNGYEGLYSDECGCQCSDLMPCGEPSPTCKPGYKVPGCYEECGEDHAFHIEPEKPHRRKRQ